MSKKRNMVPVPMPEQDMYDYVNSKPNRCEYIRSLVRKDMIKINSLDDETKKLIEDFIKRNFSDISFKENGNQDIARYSDKINKIFDM